VGTFEVEKSFARNPRNLLNFMQSVRLFSSRSSKQVVEVLYDGSCGLCRREIEFLRRTKVGCDDSQTRFINIASGNFEVQSMPHWKGQVSSIDELYSEMHVFDVSTGIMHRRVGAFRHLYLHLGVPRVLVQWTEAPPFDKMMDSAYEVFLRRIRPVLGKLLG